MWYIVFNNAYVVNSERQPKPFTQNEALMYLTEISNVPEKIRVKNNSITGRDDSFYVDKDGNEIWITSQPEQIPTLV